MISDVYSAQTLDELFVAPQPLMSAPGTIVHPVTTVDGGFHYVRDSQPYIVPPLDQPHQAPAPTFDPNHHDDNMPDADEDNWER
jgi:hypothetical protein